MPKLSKFKVSSKQGQRKKINVSRDERRILLALAWGGSITFLTDEMGKTVEVECYSREGWRMTQCNLSIFKKLKSKRLVESLGNQGYRISRAGNDVLL